MMQRRSLATRGDSTQVLEQRHALHDRVRFQGCIVAGLLALEGGNRLAHVKVDRVGLHGLRGELAGVQPPGDAVGIRKDARWKPY